MWGPGIGRRVMAMAALAFSCTESAVTAPAPRYTLVAAGLLDGHSTEVEQARDVAVAPDGSIYIVGGTSSPDFPVTPGAFDTRYDASGKEVGTSGPADAFVVKLSPAGDLIWATYLGGPNYDRAYAVKVAPDGNIFVAGRAGRGFPTTPGTLQPKFAGDSSLGPAAYGPQDGFVAKLSADGRTLLWSTYFGGSKSGFVRDVDVAPNGDVLLAATVIEDLPYITRDAAQSKRRGTSDAVFARLSPDGRSVLYATYVGGSETIPVTIPSGEPSVRSGPDGSVYFLSFNSSDDFAVTPGAYQPKRRGGVDFLVTRFAADGKVDFATYLGGSGDELCETHCLAVDASGQAYVAAYSTSLDFPMTAGAYQATAGSTEKRGDVVLAVLSADGHSLLHSTYLGGTESQVPRKASACGATPNRVRRRPSSSAAPFARRTSSRRPTPISASHTARRTATWRNSRPIFPSCATSPISAAARTTAPAATPWRRTGTS